MAIGISTSHVAFPSVSLASAKTGPTVNNGALSIRFPKIRVNNTVHQVDNRIRFTYRDK